MNNVAVKEQTAVSNEHIIRQEDAAMVSMIERIALNPDIPIDRLEKMLAMKERMEDRALDAEERLARKAYYDAMAKCQKELPVVTKNQRNTHTSSRYADLAAIETQAMPIIHKYGFGVSFQPAGYDSDGNQVLQWEISHSEGFARSGTASIPVDGAGSQGKVNKTGTQAFGSTVTYGRRYLLCMLFNISTGDDNDGNAPQDTKTITEAQRDELRDLIDKAGGDVKAFCDWAKINSLSELFASNFGKAKQALEAKIQKKASNND